MTTIHLLHQLLVVTSCEILVEYYLYIPRGKAFGIMNNKFMIVFINHIEFLNLKTLLLGQKINYNFYK